MISRRWHLFHSTERYFEIGSGGADPLSKRHAVDKKKQIDRLNLKILSVLQKEGRISNQMLAQKVSLSPSACLERVKRLEKWGYIKRYYGLIDLEKLCRCVMVIATITLHDHRKEHFQRFEEALRAMPEVVDCTKVSGSFDYFLRFVCRDMKHYDSVSDELINSNSGVIELSSHVAMDVTKDFTGFPLELLTSNL